MSIKSDFIGKTKMIDINGNKIGVEEMVDFLLRPDVIYRMVLASKLELPVLTLIAKELEEKFNQKSLFPVVITNGNYNATNKQNVGRIIRHIMKYYGYYPIDGGFSERTRLPAIASSKYFSTSAIYEKSHKSKYNILIGTYKNYNNTL